MSYPHVENQDDYARYLADVEDGSKGLDFLSSGACHACIDCNPEGLDPKAFDNDNVHWHGDSFTNFPCDLCKRRLAGDRQPGHAVWLDGEVDEDGKKPITHLELCEDCAYFLVYGQLDDETMLRVYPS